MDKHKLQAAIADAEVFLKCAKALQDAPTVTQKGQGTTNVQDPFDGNRAEADAARMASIELSRSLAILRQPSFEE